VAWWITQTIIQIGPPAVAPLLVVLQEKNVLFWNDTVRMLGTIGTPEGILALIEEVRTVRIADDTLRLIDSVGNITVDGFYRHAVKGTLTRATHAMVLAAALSSTEARANETLDPDSRWFVLVAALSSTAALPAVTPLLAAGDRYLRHVAVDVLSHVAAWGASALVDLLLPHLFDRDPVVRTATAYHLADRCDPRTTSTLIAALADSQPDVRWLATCTVGVVGDARALDPLTTVANDPRELPVIRQAATEARDRLRRTAGRDSA
jgi:HEAT repeat protein